MTERQLATLLAAASCSWHVSGLAGAPPLASLQSNSVKLAQVLQLRAFQHGCGAARARQSQLGNGFKRLCCQVPSHFFAFFCVFTLHQTFHLPYFCSFSPYQPGSHFPFFSFLFFFFDKQPGACSLPIHFIHILFPCKNSCLLGLDSASSQHKQLLRIRSDYPTDQKSSSVQAAPRAFSLSGLSGSGAALTSRSRPAFQPSCSQTGKLCSQRRNLFPQPGMSHLPAELRAEPLLIFVFWFLISFSFDCQTQDAKSIATGGAN